jgi:hypothetical protein
MSRKWIVLLITFCIFVGLSELPALGKAGTSEQNGLANRREIIPNEI